MGRPLDLGARYISRRAKNDAASGVRCRVDCSKTQVETNVIDGPFAIRRFASGKIEITLPLNDTFVRKTDVS